MDIFHPKTVRASMGALFNLNFKYFDSFAEYSSYVGKRDYFPFMLQESKALSETHFPEICSLVFGNEATGLPDSFLKIGQPLLIKHLPQLTA